MDILLAPLLLLSMQVSPDSAPADPRAGTAPACAQPVVPPVLRRDPAVRCDERVRRGQRARPPLPLDLS